MPRSLKRNHRLIIWPALAVIFLDQVSKWAVIHYLKIYESVPVLAGFFDLVHVRNRGMAFGLMNRHHYGLGFWLLLSATIVAVAFLLYWLLSLKDGDNYTTFGLSLILGGAVGNLIDRLRHGEVVDFLDFYIGSFHWPAFNVADSAITGGTFLVAITLLFRRSPV